MPATKPRSLSACQRFAFHAAQAIGARIITAGIFTRQASAVLAVAHQRARGEPVSKYNTQPRTAATEKNTIGVSEMKKRPKNTALGETANRNAAARAAATPN